MGRQWVEEVIKDRLEEAKQEGNIEEVKELESLLKKRIERGLGK